MIGLVALFGIALVLRAAGTITAWLTDTAQPEGGLAAEVEVLFHPDDPGTALDADGLNPVVYWIVTGAMLALLVALVVFVWVRVRRFTHRAEQDPRRMAGIATRHEVATTSDKALLRRAGNLPPRPDRPEAARCRIPARCAERRERVGIGRGLDHGHRPAPLRQGLHTVISDP